MKIFQIIRKNICIGCGACVEICPTHSLKILFDHDNGQFKVDIAEHLCCKCSNCSDVCPFCYDQKEDRKYPNSYFYTAFTKSFKNRYFGSSGGIVTEILQNLLLSGEVDFVSVLG